MAQKKQKKWVFGWIALGAFAIGAVLALVGLSNTVREISDEMVAKTPDAVLASAGVDETELVQLPVAYYDQRADDCVNMYDVGADDALEVRQFEWSGCKYYNEALEQGLVEYELNDEYLPVGVSGKLIPNRGINMKRWFSAVEGKSASYAGTLGMKYLGNGAEFVFDAKEFYPLDEVKFSAGDSVNVDGHNHLFTMNFAVPFTVLNSGAEEFTVWADDDTFVYVGDKLILDMGGIHDALTGRFVIYKDGRIYSGVGNEDLAYSGVRLTAEEGSIVRIFHADRDSRNSVFGVKFAGMNLSVMDAGLANSDGGVQIAYNPSDPSYVAPLGKSKVFRPDTTKGLMIMAVIEGATIVVTAALTVVAARLIVKRKMRNN